MKRILLLFIALAAVWGAAAKIRLPEIIGNDMVLQQNAEVRLWGWAEPHAAVKVETSWGAGAAVKSDAEGRWVVSVRTPAGSYQLAADYLRPASDRRSDVRPCADRRSVVRRRAEQYGDAARRLLAVSGYGCERDHRPRGRQKRKTPLCGHSACRSLYAAGPDGRKLGRPA